MPRQRTIPRTCLNCGNEFFVARLYPSDPTKGRFCSHSCSAQHQRWQGGRHTDEHGYVRLWQRSQGKLRREHRIVMEQVIGRPLARNEEVHHRNGDKSDNRPENLEILSSAEHRRLHNSQRVCALGWARHYPCCVTCGTTDRPHIARGMCSPCYHKYKRQEQ